MNRLLNKIQLFLLLIILILISSSTSVYATIRVNPARIILNELENSANTGVIEVINMGEEEVQLRAFLEDWDLNKDDDLIYYGSGETEYSLEKFIKFNPKEFVLQPGKKQIVRFTIAKTENENIPKEKRGIVFFEHKTEYIDQTSGSNIVTQVGTVIYYIPKGVKYNFKFTGLRLYNTQVSEPQGVALRIKNDGEGHIRYFPSYKIVNNDNKVVMEKKFDELIILPGHERQFSFYLEERLEPGEYKFLLNFDLFNTDQDAEYQIPIKIE